MDQAASNGAKRSEDASSAHTHTQSVVYLEIGKCPPSRNSPQGMYGFTTLRGDARLAGTADTARCTRCLSRVRNSSGTRERLVLSVRKTQVHTAFFCSS